MSKSWILPGMDAHPSGCVDGERTGFCEDLSGSELTDSQRHTKSREIVLRSVEQTVRWLRSDQRQNLPEDVESISGADLMSLDCALARWAHNLSPPNLEICGPNSVVGHEQDPLR